MSTLKNFLRTTVFLISFFQFGLALAANGYLTIRIPEAKYKEYLQGRNVELGVYCAKDSINLIAYRMNIINIRNMQKVATENGEPFYEHTFEPIIDDNYIFCHNDNKNYVFKVGVIDYVNLFDYKFFAMFGNVEAARGPGLWVYEFTNGTPNTIVKKIDHSHIKESGLRHTYTQIYYDVTCDETKPSLPPTVFWRPDFMHGDWAHGTPGNRIMGPYSLHGYPIEKDYLDAVLGKMYCNKETPSSP